MKAFKAFIDILFVSPVKNKQGFKHFSQEEKCTKAKHLKKF